MGWHARRIVPVSLVDVTGYEHIWVPILAEKFLCIDIQCNRRSGLVLGAPRMSEEEAAHGQFSARGREPARSAFGAYFPSWIFGTAVME